jgi:hypothetical protein
MDGYFWKWRMQGGALDLGAKARALLVQGDHDPCWSFESTSRTGKSIGAGWRSNEKTRLRVASRKDLTVRVSLPHVEILLSDCGSVSCR